MTLCPCSRGVDFKFNQKEVANPHNSHAPIAPEGTSFLEGWMHITQDLYLHKTADDNSPPAGGIEPSGTMTTSQEEGRQPILGRGSVSRSCENMAYFSPYI